MNNMEWEYLGSSNLVRDYFYLLNFMFYTGIIFFHSRQQEIIALSLCATKVTAGLPCFQFS